MITLPKWMQFFLGMNSRVHIKVYLNQPFFYEWWWGFSQLVFQLDDETLKDFWPYNFIYFCPFCGECPWWFDCLLRIGPSHTERQGFTPFFPPLFQFEKGTTFFQVFMFHDGKFVDNILFDNGSQITKVNFF